jgi:acetyl-CoA C-acetyltransferase
MRKVAIIGVGLTKFGEHWDKSYRQLIAEAGTQAIINAGIEGKEIEAMFGATMASGRFIGQEHIGALIADHLGLNPLPSTRLEAACASGSVALRNAIMSILSGLHDIVVVGGIEKMTDVQTERASFALGGAGDQESELFFGATFPSLYALMAKKYMHEFNATEEQLAAVAVKNHENACYNQYAQFQRKITIEDVMNSGYVATPLKLLDCSPLSDGAAAIILAEAEKAKKITDKAIEIIASEQASDTLALANRKNLIELNATKIAAKKAFERAKIKPKDVSFAEVHDCFTIAEILATEDLGFFKKGEGAKAVEEGKTRINGEIPINTSGGLKGKGHPVGATGIAQAIEAFYQLNNEAGKRQVQDAKIGLTHNVGGSGATVVVHLFKRLGD